jgi:hypothetical protein
MFWPKANFLAMHLAKTSLNVVSNIASVQQCPSTSHHNQEMRQQHHATARKLLHVVDDKLLE